MFSLDFDRLLASADRRGPLDRGYAL